MEGKKESNFRSFFIKKKKIIASVFVIIIAVSMGWYIVEYYQKEEVVVEEELPIVETASPKERDMKRQVTVIGEVDPTEKRIIIPEVSGKVETVHVEQGDHVEEGDMLMELEKDDYNLKREEAEASLRGATAKLEDAKQGARTGEKKEAETSVKRAKEAKEQMNRELERVEELHDSGFASDQELEQVELQYINAKEQLEAAEGYKESVKKGARDEELNALRSQVDRARVGVDLANRMIERTRITAPVSGEIALVDAKEDELVGTSAPAIVMLDTDSYQVIGGMPEVYVGSVEKGQNVEMKIPSVSKEYTQGTITNVGQVPPEDSQAYPLEIELDREIEEKVRAGMYSQINVTIDERESSLTIPSHAVVEMDGETGVYTVSQENQDKVVDFVKVSEGIIDDGYVEIKSGISEDEQVVVEGFAEISPGALVEVDKTNDYEMGDSS
ncbi:efflux RND transporter periplasmic adaptor subunit [Natranaerofaba carboxydovora]|uniref:efflux RND transporter periplasmic adaptor subunit n=1 Tax=Natranaerofaba carboxydovora TaxID=2742683 RepID=UPI001F144202|nr:efflux RND transporter periplasmic adaptor subunit [Natranaerofaba carboxydovora]UMZ74645.1 Multidrug resistance protein MdtA [Natranaerofaba carboxydovora]